MPAYSQGLVHFRLSSRQSSFEVNSSSGDALALRISVKCPLPFGSVAARTDLRGPGPSLPNNVFVARARVGTNIKSSVVPDDLSDRAHRGSAIWSTQFVNRAFCPVIKEALSC